MAKRGDQRVAIVGVGGLFPGATTLDGFWRMVRDGADASRDVPPARWTVPPERAIDPRPGTLDHVVSMRGYFLDPFEPILTGLDIDSNLVRDLDLLFHLALHVGRQAFHSARMNNVDRRRVGVILGSIALPTDRVSDLVREAVLGRRDAVCPLNRHVTGLPAVLLARALGLGGRAFTLDAACASSLYAIKLAVDELQSGRADAMLAGGLSRPDCLYTQMGFTQLRALSPSGKCSPFDATADGLVVGEGGGVFVLKRLEDALAHGDHIRGVIAGIGLSNDVEGNLLSPASEGQLRAMRAAYAQAGWRPDDVELIECHATGTPIGDLVEFRSLRELWSGANASDCVIGSVKSTVGHLLTGAGAASVLKVVSSLEHELLPPSANFRSPAPGIDLQRSPFRILERAAPWKKRSDGRPRRAAVSGFGFGGINAHLLIEEFVDESSTTAVPALHEIDEPIAVIAIATHADAGKFPGDDVSSIEQLAVPLGKYPIPPKELEEVLPQQLLILLAAGNAFRECGDSSRKTTGVFVGLGLDLGTTYFHMRWWAGEQSRDVMPDARKAAMDAASPPLTANRTMGALASIAASRIARTFQCGGPCFTISSGELSGIHALEVAVETLRRGEVDRALVGAVDLGSNPLETLPTGDGAVALILRRVSDAKRSNEKILAIIENHHSSPSVEYHVGADSTPRCGAAAGLMAVGRAGLALSSRILPARFDSERARFVQPSYWLHDSAYGPRCARIEAEGLLGSRAEVNLRECSLARTGSVWNRSCELFLLSENSIEGLGRRVDALRRLVVSERSLATCAETWRSLAQASPAGSLRLALVVGGLAELERSLDLVQDRMQRGIEGVLGVAGVFSGEVDLNEVGKIAFVYPGSGNHYPDMGRELGLLFPAILDQQQEENQRLRSQYAANEFWVEPCDEAHPRTVLFAQVSYGTFASDLLRSFGVEPDGVLGYSLGESAGLFGMRIWTHRDEMLRRLNESSLFETDLAFPFNAARHAWGWSDAQSIDWVTGVVPLSAATLQAAIKPDAKAYLLIINTASECVIGGHRPDVERLVESLRTTMLEVRGVTLAHCDAAATVREAYRALHHLPVTPRFDVRFYSGAWGRAYDVTSDSAAEAILDAVLETIDFPRVVEAAYADGIRTFVEVGPGSSCSRIIRCNLRDRPHRCLSFDMRQRDSLRAVLELLAELHVLGLNINQTPLNLSQPDFEGKVSAKTTVILVWPHRPRLTIPCLTENLVAMEQSVLNDDRAFLAVASSQTALGAAHETYLRFSTNTMTRIAETIASQTQLLDRWLETNPVGFLPVGAGEFITPAAEVPRSLTFEQCCEFAAGSIARVLGPTFAEADTFPTRVRLPDGPLMLVDRIVRIEGEPQSMSCGRVITEHLVHSERWYLDNGRIPTCIAVEAGQADLFLAGYLGIDLVTRGRAVYRLLDAVITVHRELPRVGDLIRYDIHIDHFFRQGNTHLFRFRFESTVNGEPLLTMTDGCAGFFTEEELASGKGIVQTALDRRPIPGKLPFDWKPLVPMRQSSLSAQQIDALRIGDLTGAFGDDFAGLKLRAPGRLPGGMLRLVDRVTHLDPEGGRFGLGVIRAESDIHPDDWFLTCHFIDDMVMPGTLMYECCLHTLRIFLMRMGWVGEEAEVVCEPVPGVSSRLKCRGQVVATTRVAAYEVSIKELGFGPEPFAIADALMYADGRPIVEMTNMSLRFHGLSREQLGRIWSKSTDPNQKVLFDRERIRAFAIGKPSEAFGDPYLVFDKERVIARLPGPPYQFLDRITRIDCEPWRMVAGGVIEAEYDVPPNEWYFAANRAPAMPFSVLLEVALQPCGWLAAYIGSALTSETDLRFRNLGGSAVQHHPVDPEIGTLNTLVKITRVSSSAGMIIQHYDFAVRSRGREVYTGNTYFGFFTKEALSNQVGFREFPLYEPSEPERSSAWSGEYPRESPYPETMLRMVDRITWYLAEGGPHRLGAAEGRIFVDPDAWFFKAHFHQDPVWPGSLGLESFLQLARFIAARRWGAFVNMMTVPALARTHQWIYRGQVLPTDHEVTVQVNVSAVDDERRLLTVEGLLSVDGRIIYRMTDFTVQA